MLASLSACPGDELLQAYLACEVSADERRVVEAHMADCSRCAGVVAAVHETGDGGEPDDTPAVLAPGTSIDRYHILDTAGAGAMGVVYAAYDPKLDRKIALKVLRRAGPDLEERLLREARAMARLSHPNVIAVHDVGTFSGGLFVAMDFIAGQTLRAWLRERRRAWPEVVAAFVAAGRGLEAAHAAGIVHRDFKPDNVLVQPDGRVAVTDFGLARAAEAAVGSGMLPAEAPLDLTATGALLGTPAYMSPEQLTGKAIDARSDLFSFCVALYAALFDKHPFPLENVAKLLAAIDSGEVRPIGDTAVPRAIRDATLAGLRPRPEDRPQSMGALLRALEPRPRRRAGMIIAVAVGAAGLAVATGVGISARRAPEAVCRGAEHRLAGVWDDERRAAVGAALTATGSPLADETVRTVDRLFDAYAGAWVAAYVDACEDTRVRGEQSEAMLDRRMACLDERRARWGALVQTLEHAQPSDVVKAAPAAYDLPLVDACADPRRVAEPEQDLAPTQAPLIALARVGIARARALGALGRYDESLAALAPALDVAGATGYLPLVAEARLAEGNLRLDADPKGAETALGAAVFAAERTGRLDVTAEAEVRLVKTLGFNQHRIDDALAWSEHARANVARLGDAVLDGDLLSALGATYDGFDTEQSLRLHREAVATLEAKLGPDHPRVASALNLEAYMLAGAGHYDESLAASRRALAIREAALGHDHTDTSSTRNNVGLALRRQGRYREARATFDEAVRALERVVGPNGRFVALVLTNLIGLEIEFERFAEAVPAARRAVAILDSRPDDLALITTLGSLSESLAGAGEVDEADAVSKRELALAGGLAAGHPLLLQAVVDRGTTLRLAGRCRDALPVLDHALRLLDAAGGARPDEIIEMLAGLGSCQLADHHLAEAEAAFTRMLALCEKGLPAGHFQTATALASLAEVDLARGNPARARERAARAVAMLEASEHAPALARARATLARAQARP